MREQTSQSRPPPSSRTLGTRTLDTTTLVVTPENVAFDFHLAGPFMRALALVVDLAILIGVVTVVGLTLIFSTGILGGNIVGQGFWGIFLFFLFFLWWGYGGAMEAFNNGQTLGKKAFGLRVVSHSGLAINASQAMLRNILRGADLVPPFFPGVFAMMFNERFQRLGDLASGTMVVVENRGARPSIARTELSTQKLEPLIPKHFDPSVSLIEALAAYVGQRKELSVGRRRELALILFEHFRRAWSLPKSVDPDLFLCALYERAAGGRAA